MPDFGNMERESSAPSGNISNGETSVHPAGILGSVRHFLDSLAAFLTAKADLVSVELQEEKRRIVDLLVMAAVMLMCFALGLTLLAFGVVIVFWSNPETALLVLAGIYLLMGGLLYIRLKRKASLSTKIFATSMEELKKDREWLHRHL